ncbi:tetratricopeptide repeat (TPR)-like superfamily protein isoform X3 [Carex rostrata]
MFSIAAINDTDSDKQWEPLAPTKEAKEFFLSQKYHEGLLKLQEKDFAKARELLEEVLKDPLISDILADNGGSDHHLRQLRFLSLKNLASVFLQLGPEYNENAMQCYLQAVELDWGDVVVWNQLGTLSCSMGSLGMARWAFEQGLISSPTNWICMEKLMEVLIAIGDEVQCLGVSKRLLEKWPSHSRAMHVMNAIERSESGPQGFDKLEPEHPRLKFKRKLDLTNSPSKRIRQDTDMQLTEATWSALVKGTLSILTSTDVHSYCSVKAYVDGSIYKESDEMDKKTIDSTPCTKEKEASATDKEQQSQERRSTRLERLRSRKSGKDEFESGRDTNVISQNLEQFILKQSSNKEVDCASPSFQVPDVSKYTPEIEASDVKQFIELIPENCNAVKLGNMLLEEFTELALPYRDYFVKLPELDKLTRQWGMERSQCCHMYLAEVCFDLGSRSDNKLKSEEFLSDSNYHICKIIEHVASNLPESVTKEGLLNDMTTDNFLEEIHNTPRKKDDSEIDNTVEKEIPSTLANKDSTDKEGNNTANQESCDDISSFWARFYWIRGCLSLASGDKGRAYDDFNRAISLLKEPVFLPHCMNEKLLTIDRINRELNSIKLDFLLRDENEIKKKVPPTECIKLLPPLLFSTKDVKLESREAVALQISALDLLISACEKEEKMKLDVYLECHKRKLQLMTADAGINVITSDLENLESVKSRQIERIVGIVRDLAKSTGLIKSFAGKGDSDGTFTSLACIIADTQSLLLTVVHGCVKLLLSRRSLVNKSEQIESTCLVDAAISFCKLQHLDPSVTTKSQVDLIVTVHELLAEYGLCCAGKDSKGEEGTFLKFAINHLLALKSLHCTNSVEEDAPHDEQTKDDDLEDNEMEELESCIDGALDQSFFCLYGLNMNPDSTSEEDLVTHQNTSRGDYQTKEQCADVFHYILPYAKTLSRSGLVKLRRVLRAIRKHFHQPPNEVMASNAIEKFLDGPDSCEKKLFEIYESNGGRDAIMNIFFPDERSSKEFEKLSISSSEPYLEVYSNLYYFIAQAEDTSATDKYAGFVLKKEGEEFVEQNANILKYDLLYNPLRFKSWQKLAHIYDEEVDLLLNDGSKHMSISDWKKNTTMHERVHTGRRRSRRCLLMSLALASTSADESEINELLALVYYDCVQNVVPFYDQRSVIPTKDATWMELCHSSMKHFEKAIALKPEWLHAFYLGKLCEKLKHSPAKAFSYYAKAGELNPTAVDPVYRLHASRLKLLYTRGKQSDVIQIVAAYAYKDSTKETISSMLGWKADDLNSSKSDASMIDSPKGEESIDPKLLDKVWLVLYDDCISALGICVEGELKHFHKARYKMALGLYRRGDAGDLERARDELSFCFKSSRSSFTVNMWEIDGMAKKGRRKNLSVGGSKKNLEVSLSESSRKFISCIRKYMLLYLNLLERIRDLPTLERAYSYLRTDKRFYLCIVDMVPVALGKYIQVLTSTIKVSSDAAAVEQLLEKMFSAFMDHASMWGEVGSLPEVNCPELSETNLFGYIHQFIRLLESDVRLHQLETINEKVRKRFKTPKLSNNNLAKVCKNASLAWCRCLLIKLALITPVPDSAGTNLTDDRSSSGNNLVLYVDLQPDELLMSSPEGQEKSKGLDMNLFEILSRIKNVQIRRVADEKMEEAVGLMRSTYNFYRESSCGTFPAGVNLYTVLVPQPVLMSDGMQIQVQPSQDVVGNLDLSIPRKLLLWAYTLVHGRYCNISMVVKYCEEMKIRTKKGLPAITNTSASPASPASQPSPSKVIRSTTVGTGGSKEKVDKEEVGEAESVVKHSDEMEIITTRLPGTSELAISQPSESKVDIDTAGACSTKEKGKTDEIYEHKHAKQPEAMKSSMAPMQLQKCDSSNAIEDAQEDCGGNKNSNTN